MSLFLFISLISLSKSILNSFINSSDIPWSTAELFLKGINPFEYYINGNKDGVILWGQEPNKFHIFYIITLPLSFISFNLSKVLWCIINVIFLIFSLMNLKKIFRLDLFSFFLASSVFLMSTPLRSSISEGQYSLFVLFFLTNYWLALDTKIKIINLSLSTIKYSLTPSFFFFSFLNEKKVFFFSLVILLLSIILFAFHTNSLYFNVIYQPLLVGLMTHLEGLSDFSKILSHLFNLNKFSSLGISVIFVLILVFYISRFPKSEITFCLLCIINLTFFPHSSYNYIFLTPLLFLFFKNDNVNFLDYIYIFPIIFYFFYEKLDSEYINFFYPFGPNTEANDLLNIQIFGFLILITAIFSLLKKAYDKKNQY